MHDLFAINHKLIQGLYSMSMTQLIETTTRPAKDTLLDHIWCSMIENVVKVSQIIFLFAFVCKFNGGIPKGKTHLTIKYRSFKDFDPTRFVDDLTRVPWQELNALDTNPDAALETFNLLFNEAINDHVPLQEKRVKLWRQPPWMTPQILSAMREHDAIKTSGKQNRNSNEWPCYRKARSEVLWKINRSKHEFYRASIKENEGQPGKMWKSINDATHTA